VTKAPATMKPIHVELRRKIEKYAGRPRARPAARFIVCACGVRVLDTNTNANTNASKYDRERERARESIDNKTAVKGVLDSNLSHYHLILLAVHIQSQ